MNNKEDLAPFLTTIGGKTVPILSTVAARREQFAMTIMPMVVAEMQRVHLSENVAFSDAALVRRAWGISIIAIAERAA
jgi:hypothetical protein